MNLEYYKKYLDILSLEELQEIEINTDSKKYPERLALIKDRIKTISELNKKNFAQNIEKVNYPDGIKFIFNCYKIIIIANIVYFAFHLKVIVYNFGQIWDLIFNFFVIVIIFYGIYKIKNWVILTAKIYSYLILLAMFLEVILLHSKAIISPLYIAFLPYQIFIFSKKEVKIFFKDTNKSII